ncbi:MAG: hypothetical protein HON98_11520 [Chloroflexi bacterium]|jgi:amino acid transporter|nr:hypothetical protein [Chloroflexota bacterium]MBT3670775.1 hypothetical protein [Chloroflexota bacterium]MBT4305143.1 hypothetical protein [Chloroflexota bacterium]MBT4533335.1 hypothetical protein [Chloroflexota bacterium]MBT4682908.1 hypothetical protein [Chloroflexota bacterium]
MRYDYTKPKPKPKKKKGQHPVWRGIGFVIMVIIPIISFGFSEIFLNYLEENVRGFSIPSQLRSGPFQITEDWVIMDILAVIAVGIVVMFFLLSIFAIINTLIYGFTRDKKSDVFEANKKEFKKKKRNIKR